MRITKSASRSELLASQQLQVALRRAWVSWWICFVRCVLCCVATVSEVLEVTNMDKSIKPLITIKTRT